MDRKRGRHDGRLREVSVPARGPGSKGRDDPIEPLQSQVRKAFRFRRAIVDPLYPIGAGCDAGYRRLPVDEIVTVLDRVNLTGNRREFNEHSSVSRMHDAVDGDRSPVLLSGWGDRPGLGAQG